MLTPAFPRLVSLPPHSSPPLAAASPTSSELESVHVPAELGPPIRNPLRQPQAGRVPSSPWSRRGPQTSTRTIGIDTNQSSQGPRSSGRSAPSAAATTRLHARRPSSPLPSTGTYPAQPLEPGHGSPTARHAPSPPAMRPYRAPTDLETPCACTVRAVSCPLRTSPRPCAGPRRSISHVSQAGAPRAHTCAVDGVRVHVRRID